MFQLSLIALLGAASVRAGSVLWDGSFDQFESTADIDKWSWSNQVGPYQWVSAYVLKLLSAHNFANLAFC